jgi:hypothetical protein
LYVNYENTSSARWTPLQNSRRRATCKTGNLPEWGLWGRFPERTAWMLRSEMAPMAPVAPEACGRCLPCEPGGNPQFRKNKCPRRSRGHLYMKNNRVCAVVDGATTRCFPLRGGYSRSVKEVIQPQVPLRLPCYDFAPVTALAFGRLIPCGFRHGLRALTASMA